MWGKKVLQIYLSESSALRFNCVVRCCTVWSTPLDSYVLSAWFWEFPISIFLKPTESIKRWEAFKGKSCTSPQVNHLQQRDEGCHACRELWCWPSYLFMANMPTKKHPRPRVYICRWIINPPDQADGCIWCHVWKELWCRAGWPSLLFMVSTPLVTPATHVSAKKRLSESTQIDTSGWWWDFVTAEMHLHAALVQRQKYIICWQNILSN